MKTCLTGIKPTATPHLGNYVGAIRPALELAKTYRSLYFIADYHALTTLRDPMALRQHTYDVAAAWLACGLDPAQTLLYRQSAIPEVFELAWVLACVLATGQLERGHAYKEALAQGGAPNAGIFNYPVLMAADVLLFDTHVVPVGRDQKQHLELARDAAVRLNHAFGDGTVVVPDALICDEQLIAGLDGQKMSKSRDNVIPVFAPAKELRAAVMKIVTGSEPLEAPKEPEPSTVFQIYRAFAGPEKTEWMAGALRTGGYGWGHAKEELFQVIDATLAPMRAVYHDLRSDEARLDAVLAEGAVKARAIARATMRRVREAVGIDHPTKTSEPKTMRMKRP